MSIIESVTIRRSRPDDEPHVRRIAALDSRPAPAGPALVAEVDGEIVAAVALDGGPPVADPFRPTADLVALLELRALQARVEHEARTAGRRAGLPSRLRALPRALRA
jgi:hypothetical protein